MDDYYSPCPRWALARPIVLAGPAATITIDELSFGGFEPGFC